METIDIDLAEVDLLTPETFANGPPHHLFDALRQHDPMHEGFTFEGRRVWSLTRYADIREVSNDVKTFTSTYGAAFIGPRHDKVSLEHAIMSSDAPYHTRLRHFFNLGFSPRVTRHFDTWIRDIVREILAQVRGQTSTFDFLQSVSGQLPAKVIGKILGMPDHDLPLMLPWAQTMLRVTEGTPDAVAAMHKMRDELFDYAREIRAHKTRNPGDDMISMLATAEYEGEKLSEREFEHFIVTTIAAGLETTFTALSQSSLLLMGQPDVYRDLRDHHPTIMTSALIELLRHVTPAMQMSRVALHDTEIHGKAVARQEEVVMWYVAANRDPAIFGADPHRIDLRRKNAVHATFGAGGPHFCIGNQLARLQLAIFFEEAFAQNIWFEQAGDVVRMRSAMINGLRALPVSLMKH